MPYKDNREYRFFRDFNLLKPEQRAEGAPDPEEQDGGIVEGYASTFEEYELYRYKGANYDEVWVEEITPGAFDDADMTDVVFLRDHTGAVMARTKNKLIDLSVDEKGLFTKTDLTKTSTARAMYEDIAVGNYSQMSFAFTIAAQEWTEIDQRKTDGLYIIKRKITAINKVFDISAVAFPANPTTDISPATRAAFNGEIERLKTERSEAQAFRREQARKALELKIKVMEAMRT